MDLWFNSKQTVSVMSLMAQRKKWDPLQVKNMECHKNILDKRAETKSVPSHVWVIHEGTENIATAEPASSAKKNIRAMNNRHPIS